MEEKIIIESTHSKKINVICSAIIIVLYVVYCEAMYLSNDAFSRIRGRGHARSRRIAF